MYISHLPNCGLDVHSVDSKHTIICRASVPLLVTRSGKDVQGSVRNAALMREAALKSTIFVGVPRVCIITHIAFLLPSVFFFFRVQAIGALAGLADALEDDVKAGLRTNSRRCAFRFTLLKSFHTGQRASGGTPSCPVLTHPPGPPIRKISKPSLLVGTRSGTPSTSRTPSNCTINSRHITLISSVGPPSSLSLTDRCVKKQ